MVEIDTREKLSAWLRKQPREVGRILGARWTLRALPILAAYQTDLLSDLALSAFRVLAASWAQVEYPNHEREVNFAAARAAGARAFAAAARAARATDAILGSEDVDDATIRASFAFAARGFAAAAADDSEGRAFAAAAGGRAFVAFAGQAAAAAFWVSISTDASARENGLSPSDIAGSPLWPDDRPVELANMWHDLKAKLHAQNENWQVWTTWYDDRLEGHVREEKRELAYVSIEDTLWDQGAATVNAEIERLIETGMPSVPTSRAATEPPRKTTSAPIAPTRIVSVPRSIFKGFFSYSHADAEVDPQIVEAFSSQLEKRVDAKLVNASFKIWRDVENLRVGDAWDEGIVAEISSIDILIVLLTPKWISSDYCRKEFNLFEKVESGRKSGGYTLPIYVGDIEGQAKYLDSEQKILYDRIKRIQCQQVIPRIFARLSAAERIELIENVADPICMMLDRLRSK